MPRETVVPSQPAVSHPALPGGRDNPATVAYEETRLGLSVGWNRVGWVQIHMFPDDAESTADWHIVDLDRGAINVLIHLLRKARDAAYGGDA